MKYINLTPQDVVLSSGKTFPATGIVAGVVMYHLKADWVIKEHKDNIPWYMLQTDMFINLPEPKEGTMYIVSPAVLYAGSILDRHDLVTPAYDHPDVIRNKKGIQCVPGFIYSIY